VSTNNAMTKPARSFLAWLRDILFLASWVFFYRVILEIFNLLKKFETKGPSSALVDEGKSST
jgi:hypothetical protein